MPSTRWIGSFTGTQNRVTFDNPRNSEYSAPVPNSFECYACSQGVVPVFHSTSCDGTHQPKWEAFAGSSLVPIPARTKSWNRSRRLPCGPFGRLLDPRSLLVKRWNRAVVIARGLSLVIDPLFFYALTLNVGDDGAAACVTWERRLGAILTVVRTCVDAFHVCHLWLQFSLPYVSRESLVVGCGRLVWDARAIALHYVRSFKGFWLDLFVMLPIPQMVLWLLVPKLLGEERIKLKILLWIFLFQYLPKFYHSIYLMRLMRKVTGFVFGSIWWGFSINLVAYLIASHVIGGCWYLLSIDGVVSCLQQQCERKRNCDLSCGGNSSTIINSTMCLDREGPLQFKLYVNALPILSTGNSLAVRVLYPVYWGLINLNTWGNVLIPSSDLIEVIFSIFIVVCGLLLFTILCGNIQLFLEVVLKNKEKMELRHQDIEWWMRRRQLPSKLKQRVRHFEHQKWETMGEEEELKWIDELPDGLRRDIKRYLCLDLIKKVPLFLTLDDLILDNICDRLKPLIFSKGEKLIQEGDPVQRMMFIVRGRVKRCQGLGKGRIGASGLEPGSFLGDELLSWCLRSPFTYRLPASSATFTCTELTEAFGLDSDDLLYITSHFKYKFASRTLKRTTRYYSSNWRTWAAVIIQLAWRKYWIRTRGPLVPSRSNGGTEGRLRRYAVMFMSLRPHDHLQ
ncbi:hypothetical protein SLEP1_g10476 [Rubroshorea leprosula]|uniref:Cyclic nucleotide-binding domain-containing protein n=1 Tax=Rubroshorea leprosula TaxID=152421 RepID=A0AAV5IJI6_9ROSI|nr:hypothetical protein SLEP1_g10476 [Rubroshorea leprosula]